MGDRQRLRRASYVPLRVTARLRCGVICDGYLHLDSVLYAAEHRDRLGAQTVTLARASAVTGDDQPHHLPLRRISVNGRPDFYYACSVAQWPAHVADGLDHWTKRIDSQYVDLLERLRSRVPISGGRYRGYRMPVAYRHALVVTWYVCGEPVEIRRLLRLVTHLGKKVSMGWGAVIEWEVEPHAEDWSVTGPDGRLMRPVPDPGGVLYGVRPPYWLPRHQVLSRVPDTEGGPPPG